jgi:tRNA dimethylallyltransferase
MLRRGSGVRRYTENVSLDRIHLLIAIAGPTGSGKSDLALAVAKECGGEIVNCDSLQLYRRMDIGTAKTPAVERCGIAHHLIDLLEPDQVFNAGEYAALARPLLRQIAERGAVPIVTGGTGFYLRALLDGLAEGPKRDNALRQDLDRREQARPGALHRILNRLDGAVASRIHPNDHNKLIRAIEICRLARRPATDVFSQGRAPLEGFHVLKIVLNPPRAALHARIAARTRGMFEAGLVEEVRDLLQSGVPKGAKAFESIGYKQALEVVDGTLTREQAIELTTIATRQYAKRQCTWFRQEHNVNWISGFGGETAVFTLALGLVHYARKVVDSYYTTSRL